MTVRELIRDKAARRAAELDYMADADRLVAKAKELAATNMPLSSRHVRQWARIAARAAIAERVDPEPQP